ncbi:hypothetical protein KAI32_00925 [Candidatus Pacearchaeota archaeon]|nr:hypothetical protein [Candidatus Pacearchaeota archaeon]
MEENGESTLSDEPPPRQNSCNSNLVEIVRDKKSIFLSPDEKKGELAVCNPALWGDKDDDIFLYRAREKWKNNYGERSVIKEYPSGRVILSPEHEYEIDGVEDPRISKNGTFNIIYTAFNEDLGARIALATTDDFKKIHKRGIIGPQIRLEEGIKFSGGKDSYYGSIFYKELQEKRKKNSNLKDYIMDKDATIVYTPKGKSILIHRVGDSVQATPFNSIEDLQTKDFWVDTFGKLEEQTILYPGEYWASEKVGLGGTPINIDGRIIGLVHGVEKIKRRRGNLIEYFYNSTVVEFDPNTYEIISIIRDPLLEPNPDYPFIENSRDETIIKNINFATAFRVKPNGTLEIFSGVGDKAIESRTTNLKYILDGLSNRHNLTENWKRAA